jgi:hypothetical protein
VLLWLSDPLMLLGLTPAEELVNTSELGGVGELFLVSKIPTIARPGQ